MNGMMFFDTLAQQPPCSYLFKGGKPDMNVLNNNHSPSLETLTSIDQENQAHGCHQERSSPVGGGVYRPISPRDYNDENYAPQDFQCSPTGNKPKYSQPRNGLMHQANHQTMVFVNSYRDGYRESFHPQNHSQYHRNVYYEKHRSYQNNWNNNNRNNNNNNNENYNENYKRQSNNNNRFYRRDELMIRRAHGLTHRFQSRSDSLKIDPKPDKLLTGGPFDQMNQDIYDAFISKAQTPETYRNKITLWHKFFLDITRCVNQYALYIVGSTMTGFGLDSSDMDMCLLTRPCTEDHRLDSLQNLYTIRQHFVKNGLTDIPNVILAKVPILKFREKDTGVEIDLNCNNAVGIYNTHMLYCYGKLDWRVRPLVGIVKIWAQFNGINNAKNVTVSSYSWTLMVLNYLQCGVHPVVLPCLHTMYPNLFNAEKRQIPDVHEEIRFGDEFRSDNTMCLSELLIGFFQYYSDFDFDRYAISVRTGSRLPIDECRNYKAPKNDVHQWKYVCIEEPFDFTNTARSVYDIMAFRFIKNVITKSYETLVSTNDLNSILPVNVGEEMPRFLGYQGERETLV